MDLGEHDFAGSLRSVARCGIIFLALASALAVIGTGMVQAEGWQRPVSYYGTLSVFLLARFASWATFALALTLGVLDFYRGEPVAPTVWFSIRWSLLAALAAEVLNFAGAMARPAGF